MCACGSAFSQHDPYSAGSASIGTAAAAGSGPTRRAVTAQHGHAADGVDNVLRDESPPGDGPTVQRRGVLGYLSRLFLGAPGGSARPVNDTQRFIELFNRDHGTVHPTAQVSTFREAVTAAKRDYKFLLVYLHSPHHQDTPAFLRDTLCTEVLQDFVDDHFVFWMGSLLYAEGYKASSLLSASGFPYLAVITTIDNVTTVCDAHEGVASAEDVMNWLINIMDTQVGRFYSFCITSCETRQRRQAVCSWQGFCQALPSPTDVVSSVGELARLVPGACQRRVRLVPLNRQRFLEASDEEE